ncbi:MAG: universal stress protein [Bacteroidia bacterium]|jgi:nucleotide-binding universal stress UspA family protein
MEKKKNIMLVPIDFSEISLNALAHAAQIAKHFDNDLVLLSILEEDFLSNIFSFSKNDTKENLAKEALMGRLKEKAAEIQNKYGIVCKVDVRSGKIYRTVIETAEEFGCDCIIMGTHGASGTERIIGSNASRVISYSSMPVIVVKTDKNPNAYKNIIFPLDLSSESKQKVKWAIHLGKSYKSTIHILTYNVGDEFLNNKLMANLKQIQLLLDENGISHSETVVDSSSDFARKTLDFAETKLADLIMIMTQQEDKSIREYVIETYAQQIVNDSGNVPVFCVNPSYDGFKSEFVI